jgi:hypothetical protein
MNFVRPEVVRVHPGAGFDPRNFQARPRQRQNRHTACGAESDYRDVDGL